MSASDTIWSGGCPPAQLLFATLDESLSSSEKTRVDGHVAECERCSSELRDARDLQRLVAAVSELDRSEPTPDTSSWIGHVQQLLEESTVSGAPGRDDRSSLDGSSVDTGTASSVRGAAPVDGPHGPRPRARDLTVSRFLARGGMADVWLARDEAGYVVVKVIHQTCADVELEGLRLYKRLADDPRAGLMPIHHIGRCEATGRLYCTMPPADPLDGRTFDPGSYEPATAESQRRREGRLALTAVQELARDVLASLARLHRQGLVHRDIKPSNLLRYHGRWCIGDTGLLLREGHGAAGELVGTPRYLPPERTNDVRSADLYALGKTIYELVNGSLDAFPVPRGDHVRSGPESDAYRRLYRVVDRACASEPGDRYGNAEAMARDLLPREPAALGLRGAIPVLLLAVAAAAIWWGTTGSPSGSGEAVPQPAPVFAERRLPLEVIIQPPGGEELAYDPAVPLYVGDTFWFVSDVSPDRRAVMVLCFYTGAVRSVLPYTPLPPADGVSSRRSTFGFDGDAKSPVGFRLQTDVSTPLLALLFPDGWDADPAELEAAVEAALEDLDSWPATRTLDPPKDADPPTALLVDDERIRRYPSPHVTRSGPPPVAGEVARRPKLVSLVQSLASRFGEVHGVLVHVDATR